MFAVSVVEPFLEVGLVTGDLLKDLDSRWGTRRLAAGRVDLLLCNVDLHRRTQLADLSERLD